MKYPVLNELKLALSKKNLLLFTAALMVILLINRFYYLKAYQQYPAQHWQELQTEQENAQVWSEAYSNRLEELKELYPEHEDLPEATLMADVWQHTTSYLQVLMNTWEKEPLDTDRILKYETLLDDQLLEVDQQGIDTGLSGLFRSTRRDWNQRLQLRSAYKAAGITEPVNPLVPTGAYLLLDGLSGDSIFSILLIALVLFWNFDMWAADFEQSTYQLYFTLPYSRTRLYVNRVIARAGLTVLGLAALCGFQFVCGTLWQGSGLDRLVILSGTATHNFGFFAMDWQNLLPADGVVPIGLAIIAEAVILLFYVFLLIAIASLISFVTRNLILTEVLLSAWLILVMTYVKYPKTHQAVGLNILLYFQSGSALSGALGIGIPLLLLLLLLASLVVHTGTCLLVAHQEL
ncbi:hypothetical protein HCH52_06550 [Oscillospiraceae bacterium HV4-5-C5C]|nr:hypothetical protein [Oscillospiraceae bacterium HV4-5-C5C]